ncbi:Os02g0808500 [Oryza sativa Japonica Group]|uniref:Os02g0808500 protein n=2 Tax=Oryza sativa subsp. japonica TaxID=39947 RepID=Q6K9A4_ORYSJ|nr:uncharacterized protein LOC4331084 [Oryza sativa Japonica Group]KAB8089432.1 hypothetical protein EE612_014368 [Oryza sativa]EEE58019.1 hypothetical protein OsJ_08804 [Oryza sativa Japonica Group]BAD19131.1 unknown protein [Oryza sativa Japonica Group]BAD19246.1 unknown protein [Oryza sativa Japonica Group]BAF10373.1 Os02g0808500 [Oryza sativa Japonica Group]|eukprot:NP_001048459.1 Os02g0808500 [Oryza sativa Japonica Group]
MAPGGAAMGRPDPAGSGVGVFLTASSSRTTSGGVVVLAEVAADRSPVAVLVFRPPHFLPSFSSRHASLLRPSRVPSSSGRHARRIWPRTATAGSSAVHGDGGLGGSSARRRRQAG